MMIYKKKYYTETEKTSAKHSVNPTGKVPYKFTPVKNKPIASNNANQSNSTAGITVPNMTHRVLTKMGYGPTPELVNHINALAGSNEEEKLLSYIQEQLNPDLIDDSFSDSQLTHGYETLNKTRIQLYQEHNRLPDGGDIEWEDHVRPGRETFYATFSRALSSKRQLNEMMADFWHNHFNVYMDSDEVPAMFVHYDRDVIRKNVLGNFREMLEDVTKSTCMLNYLGNGVNNKEAPNENFARELLELHTIGAKNYLGHMPAADVPTDDQGRKTGYVEEDVLEMSRVLTGWSFSGADWWDYQNGAIATGEFLYRDDWHDKGDKLIMGTTFSFDESQELKDMQDVLDMLAEHPATAGFLARKLCIRFISDAPSQGIVEAVKQTLHENWQSPDQIKLAMNTLLTSQEFFNTWGEKIKRPFERVASCMRQLGIDYDFSPLKEHTSWMFWEFNGTGHNLFHWTSPNGYPDKKSSWLGASSIMATWRYMQWMSRFRDNANQTYNNVLALTLDQFPNASDRTANNLVNYWFERACGQPADVATQEKLAEFMSYDDTQEPIGTDRNTPIDITTSDWPDYNEERLYAVISTIFLTSEFNYR